MRCDSSAICAGSPKVPSEFKLCAMCRGRQGVGIPGCRRPSEPWFCSRGSRVPTSITSAIRTTRYGALSGVGRRWPDLSSDIHGVGIEVLHEYLDLRDPLLESWTLAPLGHGLLASPWPETDEALGRVTILQQLGHVDPGTLAADHSAKSRQAATNSSCLPAFAVHSPSVKSCATTNS